MVAGSSVQVEVLVRLVPGLGLCHSSCASALRHSGWHCQWQCVVAHWQVASESLHVVDTVTAWQWNPPLEPRRLGVPGRRVTATDTVTGSASASSCHCSGTGRPATLAPWRPGPPDPPGRPSRRCHCHCHSGCHSAGTGSGRRSATGSTSTASGTGTGSGRRRLRVGPAGHWQRRPGRSGGGGPGGETLADSDSDCKFGAGLTGTGTY